MIEIEELKALWQQQQEEMLSDYFSFLKFQSISSEQQYRSDTVGCANWLVAYLKSIGFETEVWETKGYPVVYASHLGAGADQPTVLIYHHYDVQPVDPIEKWDSPPFSPRLHEGQVWARGAQDNKGQCFYVLFALKLLLEHVGHLPVNVKLCIEGEEEIGSPNFPSILEEKKQQLKADYLAIVDSGIPNMSTPSVTAGVRGIVAMDVVCKGSFVDLHSGSHGGVAYNPNHALVEVLSSLRREDGKIAVPGFYDDIEPIRREEKEQLLAEIDEEEYQRMFGTLTTGGEKEFSPAERRALRPTLEINGLSGGYAGQGFKTVIPAEAKAKISCRLVPNQDPEKIGRLVKEFIEKKAPKGIRVEVHIHAGEGKGVWTGTSSKVVQAFSQAYTEVFGKKCRYTLFGGSIPPAAKLAEASGAEVAIVGLGLPDDNIHAPNEHFGVDRLELGMMITCRALYHLRA